jgi:hypothetical protein
MAPLLAVITGLLFVALYKNISENKKIRSHVAKPIPKSHWHHVAGMAALALNIPTIAGAATHPSALHAYGGLLVAAVWLGMRHRTESSLAKHR